MKKQLFVLILLAMSCMAAQAQHETFRLTFDHSVDKIVLNDHAVATIVVDSSDYLIIEHPGKTLGADNVIYRINGRGVLTIEGRDTTVGRVSIHLSPKENIEFQANDYTMLYLPAYRVNNIQLVTNGHSKTVINPFQDNDTMQTVKLIIDANDYSSIDVNVPIATDVMKASSYDHAHINFSSVKGRVIDVADRDFSHISLDRRDLTLGSVADNHEPNFDHHIQKIIRNHGHRFPSEPFTLRFGWAFNNWGSRPYNGLSKLPGAYNLKTTFSSYQIEGTYYLLRSRHWAIGLGLGYESDIYKFSNNFVDLTKNAGNTYAFDIVDTTENNGTWNSRLVTRYINIPITVRWTPDNSFQLGLTLLPGLNYCSRNTDLKRTFESRDRTINERVETSEVVRSYKFDIRFTFGWEHFQCFAQIATLPVFRNTNQRAYPFKLGFMLEL